MRTTRLLFVAALFLSASAGFAQDARWLRTTSGIVVTPAGGLTRKIRLDVMAGGLIHVTASPADTFAHASSLMVVAAPSGRFTVRATPTTVTLHATTASATVSLRDGRIVFRNANGTPVLTEADRSFEPFDIEGRRFYRIRQQFNRGTDEGFYGLGQHQNRQMNYNGEDVVLEQHNMVVAVPFVLSTRNYGVLWDNYSITRFGDAREYQPIDQTLTLFDARGRKGGLTARYYRGDTLAVERVESDPNYQYIKDQVNWPAEVKGAGNRRVVWQGSVQAARGGTHKFRLYVSGYFKLLVNDSLVLDGWRQNWQGWYRTFDLRMTRGASQKLRIEWTPQDGYFRLLHLDPLPDAERHALSFSSDVAHDVDYYFVAGANMDQVIAGYRTLTGKAVLLPRWAYGYWQSRQRYETQDQLLAVLRRYRSAGIPLDNIVQDWFYWPEDQWGSHDFDRTRFPDARAMVQQVHAANAHIMISVWPKFYPNTRHFQELDEAGGMYHGNIAMGNKDWVGPGYLNSFYDPYSPAARDMYWRQVREKIDRLGFDAYWLDSDEPDMHSNLSVPERMRIMGPTARGPAAQFFNSYALLHVGGVYDHWHADHPDQRSFILTRSGFGGVQRYGAAIWSGDIVSRWSDMRDQISAGVNLSMSGIPNWSFDIGGYTMEDRFVHGTPEDLAEWRELYVRWFQVGAFVPIFRAHGELRPREIFEIAPPGSQIYDILLSYDQLRYRLMPYIYSTAAHTWHDDYTMMRGLVMDFGADRNVWNIDDEYMFGPSLLVAPVTEYRARTRSVYLPASSAWYDFHTGRRFAGGQRIAAAAPLERMPLYVRAGAILPIGPEIQYTDQKPAAPITLLVYDGADGRFTLYDDDGTTTAYQRGAFARTPITWHDATRTLHIGARTGSYPGMARQRELRVRWVCPAAGKRFLLDAEPDMVLTYSGEKMAVARARHRTCR